MAPSKQFGYVPNRQKGQAIVLVGLLILVLFAMLGLAIDSGRAYVDRRDQQTAVDAAALAAGDWYENFHDLYGSTLPNSKQIYQNNLHLYSGSIVRRRRRPPWSGRRAISSRTPTWSPTPAATR